MKKKKEKNYVQGIYDGQTGFWYVLNPKHFKIVPEKSIKKLLDKINKRYHGVLTDFKEDMSDEAIN